MRMYFDHSVMPKRKHPTKNPEPPSDSEYDSSDYGSDSTSDDTHPPKRDTKLMILSDRTLCWSNGDFCRLNNSLESVDPHDSIPPDKYCETYDIPELFSMKSDGSISCEHHDSCPLTTYKKGGVFTSPPRAGMYFMATMKIDIDTPQYCSICMECWNSKKFFWNK